MSFDILVLSQADVEASASVEDYLEAAEEAFRATAESDCESSPKNHWEFSVGKSAAFASYLRPRGVMAIKLGTIRSRNVDQFGLPPGISQIVIHEASSGRPLAILDGTRVTAMRTAAAAALAAKVLARPDSKAAAIFGTGVVAQKSLQMLAAVLPIETARIVGSSFRRAEAFVAENAHLFPFPIEPGNPQESVRTSEVVITATTSTAPVVQDEWIQPGTHISAVGSDWSGKQELDVRTLLRAVLVTDSYVQCLEIGEGNVPYASGQLERADIDAELGEILTGQHPGRSGDEQISVFDSSGISIQDCTAAAKIYDRASARKLGVRVKL